MLQVIDMVELFKVVDRIAKVIEVVEYWMYWKIKRKYKRKIKSILYRKIKTLC